MKSMFALAATALVLVIVGRQAPAQDQKAASLIGKYRITSGQEGAKRLAAEELKQDVVHIEKNAITVYDKAKKKLYTATYTLDANKKPWVIHMTSTVAPIEGVKSVGLIDKEGDTVRLIYALPGGAPPTSFEPLAKQMLFTMKKQADGAAQ